MYKTRLLFALLIFSFSSVYAQYYPVSLIPDSLKSNASLVIRDEVRKVELKSVNSGIERITRILTILNKEGENMAYLALFYDKNSSVRINEIAYYDGNGKKMRNVKMSEITDSPAFTSSQLYTDSRIKLFRPNQPVYPYTVKYDYETDLSNIISFRPWRPFTAYNVSAQHTLFIFSHPDKIAINKKEINVQIKKSEKESDVTTDTWEISNLKSIEDEPYDISLTERIPCVYLMPSLLLYDSYRGNADTWSEYGKWFRSLYKGRDELSDDEKARVNSIVKDIPDTLERIRNLYKYMQENTRYVLVKLGLGGFQPFDAKTVFETGYGDCKALSNYMYSLLKFIGVKSYIAIVSSGTYKEPIIHDFPNFQQFDHAILCVPRSSDTLWLECTNQTIPFGFLGDFTDDRDVLLITENGGIFAHTTKYEAKDNTRSCRSEFNIDSTGQAICSVRTIFRGLQYDNISELLSSDYDEQKKLLYSNSTLPSLQIGTFSVNDLKGRIPVARINESEISKTYCSFSGNYMLLPLNILNPQKSIQKMLKPRYSDVIISRSSIDYDTLIYKIPKNYKYESLPSPVTINSRFGNYACSVSAKENEIIYIRKFTILEGRYRPSEYKELYDFILAVSKADNSKVLLSKKARSL